MTDHYKYPRTPHLQWSLGASSDDVFTDGEHLRGREVVVTEKLDGENTNFYADKYHARSLDSRHHPSRDWVKAYWGSLRHRIPDGWRICGENVYAVHSITYESLETYFYGFAVYDDRNICFSWDDTLTVFEMLGVTPVPTLYRGVYNEEKLVKLAGQLDLVRQEGYVVRVTDAFEYEPVLSLAGKFVRKGHVQSDEHWMHKPVVPNKLRS